MSKLLTISKCLQLNRYQIQQLLAIVKNSMVNKKHCFEHAERFHISHITCSIILLGDSWNYMPPIVVPSSAKHIATQVLVNGRKDFFWEASFVMSSVPTRNYLFKVSNWNTRIRCENCSRLRMKTLERCQWRRSSVFIVNCEHISNFLLIIDFEQAKVCRVHIEKRNTFENKIRCTMR